MRWRSFVYVLVAPIFFACSGDGILSSELTASRDMRILAIQALPGNKLGALVRHQAPPRFESHTPRPISQTPDSPRGRTLIPRS